MDDARKSALEVMQDVAKVSKGRIIFTDWPCTCTPPYVISIPALPGGGGCPRHDRSLDQPWTERDEKEMEKRYPGWRERAIEDALKRLDG